MKEFIAYLRFGFGVRRASYLTWGRWGSWRRWTRAFNLLAGALAALMLVFVYALTQWIDERPAQPTEHIKPAAYTSALEALAATCLTPGESWVKVGDDHYLVGAYKL